MRYVALAAVVALFGGYVVGQQPVVPEPADDLEPPASSDKDAPGLSQGHRAIIGHSITKPKRSAEAATEKRVPNSIDGQPSTEGWLYVPSANVAVPAQLLERKRALGLIDSEAHPGFTEGERPSWWKGHFYDAGSSEPRVEKNAPQPVGRYVPFGNDLLLDTTNGTLYRINGRVWVDVVKMKEPKTQAVAPVDDSGIDGIDVDDLLRSN
jgi:hypothetical protein